MKVSHEKHCGFNIHPYYLTVPHPPAIALLSISEVRCYGVTTCLLHAALPSPWPPYIVIANYSAP